MDVLKVLSNISKVDSKAFLFDLGQIVLKADDFIIFLQQEQLSEGLDSDNETVGFYTRYTEEIAQIENPIQTKRAGEPYNFEWAGSFFKGMFISVDFSDNFSITIDSTSDSAKELQKKYKELLGLIETNESKFIEWLNLEILKYVNNVWM